MEVVTVVEMETFKSFYTVSQINGDDTTDAL